ncbi:mitochondrial thiamine pyrophosphate transporter [Podila epicladia]|nr:mitochondrial thiamine pyrophosphate transporter [Podila epicladia]
MDARHAGDNGDNSTEDTSSSTENTTRPVNHAHKSQMIRSNTESKSQKERSSIAAGAPSLSKTETVFCGATAGVVSRFVIAPLDVVKIRLQMQTQRTDLSTLLGRELISHASAGESGLNRPLRPKYRGMFSGMAMIVREEGIRGLWKGNMAAEYLYLTYSGIQFLVYSQTKLLLAKTAKVSAEKAAKIKDSTTTTSAKIPGAKATVAAPLSAVSVLTSSSAIQSFVSGANAGIVATACTYPFDLLRTRFAIQRDVKIYTGIIQASQHIFKQDGILGFYRGMSPALIQVVPYMGIMFGSYDTLKHLTAWLKHKANVTASSSSSSSEGSTKSVGQVLLGLEDLLCGALSGIISKTGVYPLDMVRKRLQIQGSEQQKINASIFSPHSAKAAEALPKSVWKCMVHIARHEGYLALYKGLLPGLLKAAPASATTFLVFSQAGAFVEKWRKSKLSDSS